MYIECLKEVTLFSIIFLYYLTVMKFHLAQPVYTCFKQKYAKTNSQETTVDQLSHRFHSSSASFQPSRHCRRGKALGDACDVHVHRDSVMKAEPEKGFGSGHRPGNRKDTVKHHPVPTPDKNTHTHTISHHPLFNSCGGWLRFSNGFECGLLVRD